MMKGYIKKINIRRFFPLVAIALVVLFILSFITAYLLYQKSENLSKINTQYSLLSDRFDELEGNSEDLTKYARLYAATGDTQHRETYNQILAIRLGEAPRPQNYGRTYWNLNKKTRAAHHSPGEKINFQESLWQLPMTSGEAAKVQKSEIAFDQLVSLEKKAIALIDKIIQGEGNKEHAVNLLNSPEHAEIKHQVMLPLSELRESIKLRLNGENIQLRNHINNMFAVFYVISLLFFAVLLLMIHFSRTRILQPVYALDDAIKKGFEKFPDNVFHEYEVGRLAKKFFEMKENMEKSYQDLKELSFRDNLTGVFNRNYFFQAAEIEHRRQKREDNHLCLMMLDIDHFKSVNDTYGHLIGDDVLKKISQNISGAIRETDVLARFGGEEFIVLLINSNISDGKHIAEKIRAKVAEEIFQIKDADHSTKFNVTVSIGVSLVRKNDESINIAISLADRALYEAKDEGRNQVKAQL